MQGDGKYYSAEIEQTRQQQDLAGGRAQEACNELLEVKVG